MNRKRVTIGIVSVVATVVVLAATIALLRISDANVSTAVTPQQTTTSQRSQPLSFTEENGRMLEAALSSRSKDEQAKAFIPGLRQADWNPETVLPSGATLKIDRSSFEKDTDIDGKVTATVIGSVKGTFILNLMWVDDQWLISSTIQK